jgi:hypothetical protein
VYHRSIPDRDSSGNRGVVRALAELNRKFLTFLDRELTLVHCHQIIEAERAPAANLDKGVVAQ